MEKDWQIHKNTESDLTNILGGAAGKKTVIKKNAIALLGRLYKDLVIIDAEVIVNHKEPGNGSIRYLSRKKSPDELNKEEEERNRPTPNRGHFNPYR